MSTPRFLVAAAGPEAPPPPAASPPPAAARPPLWGDALGRLALAVVAVALALSVWRAFGPLTYPLDIWRQADAASIARYYAENGMRLFYPQIAWGGAGPGYVESELPIMPWLAAGFFVLFGEHPVFGRLISLAFMIVATVAFASLAQRRLRPVAARWALILFVVSPMFARYATAFLPEATALCFFVLTLWAFDRWLTEDRPRWLIVAAVSTSLAGLAESAALAVVPVLLVWLLLTAPERLRRWQVPVTVVLSLVAPALWLWFAHGLHLRYGNTLETVPGGSAGFGTLHNLFSLGFFTGNLGTEGRWTLGLVGVPFAVIGFVRAVRAPRDGLVIGGVVGLAVLYAMVARYSESGLGTQYHVFSLPIAAILVGLGVERAADVVAERAAALRAGLAALLALALAALSLQVYADSTADQSGIFGRCAVALDAVSATGDLVAVTSRSPELDGGVPNNWHEPVVFYMADRRGWSIASDGLSAAALDAGRVAGARWFVLSDPPQLAERPPVEAWLHAHATPVSTAATRGCDIWKLT